MTYVTLVGSEQVERAGHQMARAAESFAASVGNLSGELRMHRMQMEELVARFEQAAEGMKPRQEGS